MTAGAYDAQKQRPRRALFVVDAAGTIAWSAAFPEALDPGIDGVLTALEALGALGAPELVAREANQILRQG